MTGPQLTSVSCRLHKDGFFNLDEEDVYIKTEDEFLCGWRKKGTHPIALVCEACYIAGTINFAECWQIEGIYNDVGGPKIYYQFQVKGEKRQLWALLQDERTAPSGNYTTVGVRLRTQNNEQECIGISSLRFILVRDVETMARLKMNPKNLETLPDAEDPYVNMLAVETTYRHATRVSLSSFSSSCDEDMYNAEAAYEPPHGGPSSSQGATTVHMPIDTTFQPSYQPIQDVGRSERTPEHRDEPAIADAVDCTGSLSATQTIPSAYTLPQHLLRPGQTTTPTTASSTRHIQTASGTDAIAAIEKRQARMAKRAELERVKRERAELEIAVRQLDEQDRLQEEADDEELRRENEEVERLRQLRQMYEV